MRNCSPERGGVIIGFVRLSSLILIVAAGAVALWALLANEPSAHSDPCGSVTETPRSAGLRAAGEATICLLNRERVRHGLPAFRENALLDQASLEHSQDMVRGDYFAHATPDGRGVLDRLAAVGYTTGRTGSAGENIAWALGDKATPAAIVTLWMHSPPHRADILRRSFSEIGIGIAFGAPNSATVMQANAATYTTDFGGLYDSSLPTG